MRIGFDARFYAETGGIGRYVQRLLSELERQDQKNEYFILLNKKGGQNYQSQNPRFHKIEADWRWYTLKEQLFLKPLIKKLKIDFIHFPHWNIPLNYSDPFIFTLHDLILLRFPSRRGSRHGPWLYKLKYWGYQKVLRHAIFFAKKILVPSEFVKKDILETFPVAPKKIVVTYEGAGLAASNNSAGQPRTDREIIRKYHIIKPYFLYVGAAYPNKNLEGLIKAFQIFQNKYSPDYQLVLVGKKDYFYSRLSKAIRDDSEFAGANNVIFTDYIPDEELPCLYHHSSLFIFPSFYEGFGLPPLEAMAQGAPVISSDASCLPEILGKAALYFNPNYHEQMAAAINKIITDKKLAFDLSQRGRRQIKKYSWQKCAQATLQEYEKMI